MKANYLFPHRYKKLGWMILVPSLILGLAYLIFQFEPDFLKVQVPALMEKPILDDGGFFFWTETNLIDEIITILLIVSCALVAFSREKTEDEFIARIRLESLVWATYVNYIILALSTILVYGMSYFWVLVLNMFTILLFFIIRFRWILYKTGQSASYEE